VSIAAKGAVADGAWNAWTGTMKVSSPYTTVGSEYCMSTRRFALEPPRRRQAPSYVPSA
jgi:hypothetical protein